MPTSAEGGDSLRFVHPPSSEGGDSIRPMRPQAPKAPTPLTFLN